tara:strand:- start:304 stop:825 length:522 start_codon:yes stop_codon:yes gene_type:complete
VVYKKPKNTNLVIFLIIILLIVINIPDDSVATDLGNYYLNDSGSTKLILNVFDVKNLEIHIIDIYESTEDKFCKFDEIYIYGSLKSTGKFVRIRVGEVTVSSGLKVLNKAQSEHYSRQFYQEPVQIISRTFNCNDESIYIRFEENLNVDYLQFIQNENNEYKAFRTLNIKALS